MLDPAITDFFDERKEAWLKKNIKASMSEGELRILHQECDRTFSLDEWLLQNAKKASSRAVTTHPSKFSHPSTGIGTKNKKNYTYVSPAICIAEKACDGFLRSGNVDVELDSLGDAAALTIDAFLALKLLDGKTLLMHIKKESVLAKSLLNIDSVSYVKLRNMLLEISKPAYEISTSSKVKQVYFPVNTQYHLLSILSSSGMIYKLRQRIDDMSFSDNVKEARDKKKNGEYSLHGYSEILGLTVIGYGGAQPQNISVLNTRKKGKAHLLPLLPPTIEKRYIHFPKTNFFKESFRRYECRDSFQALHKLLNTDYNNIKIREGRDYRLQEIIDRIVDKMWAVRSVSLAQYSQKTSGLKRHQLIWLSSEFAKERETTDQWLDTLCKEISSWLIIFYQKTMGKQAVKLSDVELMHVLTVVQKSKEALR